MKKDYDKREKLINYIEGETGIYADWSSLDDDALLQLKDYVESNYQENRDW